MTFRTCGDHLGMTAPIKSSCDASLSRFAGAILPVHRAWPPPRPPDEQPEGIHDVAGALGFVSNLSLRYGWVPTVLQELHVVGTAPRLHGHRCSDSRFEDHALLRTFFTTADGRPTRGADNVIFEMGAYDGTTESTSWIFERCLGWRAVVVEAQPLRFPTIVERRPHAFSLRMAACDDEGVISLAGTGTGARVVGLNVTDPMLSINTRTGRMERIGSGYNSGFNNAVRCGRLGATLLGAVGLTRIDIFSLDVEGSEMAALRSLGDAHLQGLSIGVLMVEVRGDGQRGEMMQVLMSRGFSYVGQINGRPSPANEIIDDVYVNMSHLRRYHPDSCGLRDGPSTDSGDGAAPVLSRGRMSRAAAPLPARATPFDQQLKFQMDLGARKLAAEQALRQKSLAAQAAQRAGSMAGSQQPAQTQRAVGLQLAREWAGCESGHAGMCRANASFMGLARLGYCATTDESETGCRAPMAQGSFGFEPEEARDWTDAASSCMRKCLACKRCRYISLSPHHRDCSWYANCDMNALNTVAHGAQFISIPARRPSQPSPTPLRLDGSRSAH